MKFKYLIVGYIVSTFALFLYSFTQVDLGLTLTRHPFWLSYQRFFQRIGYFDRPLSTYLFVTIVLILFILYFISLWLTWKNKISQKQLWVVIITSTVILVFSYNAFSYDLFNYIFDARIVTYYHQNPYLHKALDYPGDAMLSFMHWTHRLYPYGLVWLVLTIPLSFIMFQFFLPTFFLFKILVGLSFLACVYFLFKIAQKMQPGKENLIAALFALNPLVLIESLVSAHNDIVMMAFFMAGFYYLLSKKTAWAIILVLLSIGVKFATVFLVPFLICVYFSQKKQKINRKILLVAVVSALIPVVIASLRTQFQPWYLLYALPLAALIPEYFVIVPIIIVSLFALFEYIPYLYLGNWDPPVPQTLLNIRISGLLLSAIMVFAGAVGKKYFGKIFAK